MAKYTIEVEGVYVISILAPLAELISHEADNDRLQLYLHESILALLDECKDFVSVTKLDEDKWEKVARHAELLTIRIREVLGGPINNA